MRSRNKESFDAPCSVCTCITYVHKKQHARNLIYIEFTIIGGFMFALFSKLWDEINLLMVDRNRIRNVLIETDCGILWAK